MIILIGASASGKTEVCKALCYSFGYKKFVTTTTRSKRRGEIDGIDYFFITNEEFNKRVKENKFIEHILYNGNQYGTEKNQIDDKTVLVLEPDGLKEFKKLNDPHIISFFLKSSSNIRKERMRIRGDEESVIEKRLILDENKFNKENMTPADFEIDSDKETIKELANEIHSLYIKKIEAN